MKKEIQEKITGKGFEFDNSLNRFGNLRHDYYFNGRLMTGVTTILGVIGGDKSQNIIQWAADLAAIAGLEAEQITGIKVEYEVIQKIEDWKEKKKAKQELDKKYPTYYESRLAHRRKKEDAGSKGTDVHIIIEEIIKDVIKIDGMIPATLENDSPQVQHLIEWSIKNKVKFIESEKRMYSKKHWIAGTCDFVCEIDGKRYVGDIKTSSGIYDRTPFFQTAGYRLMLEEMGEGSNVKNTFWARIIRKIKGIKIEKPIYHGSVIVNIKKNGTFADKDVHYSYSYEDDLAGFLAALTLYRKLKTF